MENLVVIVFDKDEPKALEGLRVLEELDSQSEIWLYEARVAVKTPNGPVRVIEKKDNLTLPLVGGASILGALIGLLGGPVGAAAGAAAGAMVASLADSEEASFSEEFVHEVSMALQCGETAIVADLDEDSVVPVDSHMAKLGGVVFRRARALVEGTQSDRDATLYRAETEELKAEHLQSRADRLAKIDARVDLERQRLEAALERKRAAMKKREESREARIGLLQARAEQTAGDLRLKCDAHAAHQNDGGERGVELQSISNPAPAGEVDGNGKNDRSGF